MALRHLPLFLRRLGKFQAISPIFIVNVKNRSNMYFTAHVPTRRAIGYIKTIATCRCNKISSNFILLDPLD